MKNYAIMYLLNLFIFIQIINYEKQCNLLNEKLEKTITYYNDKISEITNKYNNDKDNLLNQIKNIVLYYYIE